MKLILLLGLTSQVVGALKLDAKTEWNDPRDIGGCHFDLVEMKERAPTQNYNYICDATTNTLLYNGLTWYAASAPDENCVALHYVKGTPPACPVGIRGGCKYCGTTKSWQLDVQGWTRLNIRSSRDGMGGYFGCHTLSKAECNSHPTPPVIKEMSPPSIVNVYKQLPPQSLAREPNSGTTNPPRPKVLVPQGNNMWYVYKPPQKMPTPASIRADAKAAAAAQAAKILKVPSLTTGVKVPGPTSRGVPVGLAAKLDEATYRSMSSKLEKMRKDRSSYVTEYNVVGGNEAGVSGAYRGRPRVSTLAQHMLLVSGSQADSNKKTQRHTAKQKLNNQVKAKNRALTKHSRLKSASQAKSHKKTRLDQLMSRLTALEHSKRKSAHSSKVKTASLLATDSHDTNGDEDDDDDDGDADDDDDDDEEEDDDDDDDDDDLMTMMID
eukprot:TRINITY_DN2483_c0_g2_i1.p1 TRINITY_DN2483_c0_g2~~TRINITY_DN2483_c0_g2_i1.p1  ORF type:complete len:437 (+),score=84.64 TRINITY_DN2483_c0_g2_i1:105-1415(+)